MKHLSFLAIVSITLSFLLNSCATSYDHISYKGKRIPTHNPKPVTEIQKKEKELSKVSSEKNQKDEIKPFEKIEKSTLALNEVNLKKENQKSSSNKSTQKETTTIKKTNKIKEKGLAEENKTSQIFNSFSQEQFLAFQEKLQSQNLFQNKNHFAQKIDAKDIQAGDSFLMLLLYLLLCMILPPLAIFLMKDGVSFEFWLSLLLILATVVFANLPLLSFVAVLAFLLAVILAVYVFFTEFV